MGQFTVEVSAVGHKEEVVTADNGQDAHDETMRELVNELPDWVDVSIRDVSAEGHERLPESDD